MSWKSGANWKLHAAALIGVALVTLFQNCSGYQSADYASVAGAAAVRPPVPTCVFNGQVVSSGSSVTAYLNGSGTCTAQTRTCQDNGVLSGTYGYASCVAGGGSSTGGGLSTGGGSSSGGGSTTGGGTSTGGTAPCLFNGRTIASGDQVNAFVTTVADAACVSESRVCTNGVLSGGFAYDTCEVAGPAACVFNGRVIPSGQSVVAFARGQMVNGSVCAPQVRTCANGALSGAGEYASCVVTGNSPCLFDGQTLADGQTVVAYASSTGSCAPVSRTCQNGSMSGAGDYAACDATKPAACLFNGRTIASGDAVRAFTSAATNVGEACAIEARACSAGTLSGSATASDCLPRAKFISNDYVRPATAQGLADSHYGEDAATLDTRYAKFKSIGIGVKIYNYFWSQLENSPVASSTSPVTCPTQWTMTPANEAERVKWGYHRYRCLNDPTVQQFDRSMTRDAANGIQSAIVFWSAPAQYRHPGCLGNSWAGGTLFDGCVPRDDAMDDLEDVMTFLSLHHNGRNGFGKISHFVVWNENASGLWFDYSPVVPNRGVLNAAQIDTWLNKYAAMMARTHDAAQRTSGGVMIDASTDLYWTPPHISANESAHIGDATLLAGLWQKLGTNYSWSVAVHPYGDVDKQAGPGQYNFDNVQNLVAGFQNQQLVARGLPTGGFQYPQGFLIASEQGWPQSEGIDKQAMNICQAHAATLNSPFILSQTHNYFQSQEPQETTGGSSGQGAFYGLLPYRSAVDLSDMASYATGAAYISTGPSTWGQTSSNYCCQAAGVGCLLPAGMQPIYRSFGSHHMFSLYFTEGPSAGFTPERIAFNLYSNPGGDLAPLYRCRSAATGDYMISPRADCEGLTTEGLLGYAHQTAAAGLIPIYRKLNAKTGDHLATTAQDEGAPSYATEQTLGYVPSL